MFSHGSISVQLHDSTAVVIHFLQENDYIVKKKKQLGIKKIPALQNTPTFH